MPEGRQQMGPIFTWLDIIIICILDDREKSGEARGSCFRQVTAAVNRKCKIQEGASEQHAMVTKMMHAQKIVKLYLIIGLTRLTQLIIELYMKNYDVFQVPQPRFCHRRMQPSQAAIAKQLVGPGSYPGG